MSRCVAWRTGVSAISICAMALALALMVPAAGASAGAVFPCPSTSSSLNLETKTPVLLVHGLGESPGVWSSGSTSMTGAITNALGADVQLFTFGYKDENTDWVTDEHIGRRLAECITWLADGSRAGGGPGEVVIVVHSMGGLAVRCAVDPACVNTTNTTGTPWPAANAEDIGLLITLDTPNTGPTKQLSKLGQLLCDRVPRCPGYLGLVRTPAGKAIIGLEPGTKTPTKLQPLPIEIPLDAIAGKITVKVTLLTAGTFDVGGEEVDNFGDLVVPVDSALAGAPGDGTPSGTPHAGPGAGSTIEDCGTVRAYTLIGIGSIPINVNCWHLTEITDPEWQADVVNAIKAYQAAMTATIAHDEAVINQLHQQCSAYEPVSQGCPFSVAETTDGHGGLVYAIVLKATAGDSCSGSIVYFFDGEKLITDTTRLPPATEPRAAAISSPKPAQFKVTWLVNPSANSACFQYYTAGTDSYLYGWNGSTMTLITGTPPQPPKAFPPGAPSASPPSMAPAPSAARALATNLACAALKGETGGSFPAGTHCRSVYFRQSPIDPSYAIVTLELFNAADAGVSDEAAALVNVANGKMVLPPANQLGLCPPAGDYAPPSGVPTSVLTSLQLPTHCPA